MPRLLPDLDIHELFPPSSTELTGPLIQASFPFCVPGPQTRREEAPSSPHRESTADVTDTHTNEVGRDCADAVEPRGMKAPPRFPPACLHPCCLPYPDGVP